MNEGIGSRGWNLWKQELQEEIGCAVEESCSVLRRTFCCSWLQSLRAFISADVIKRPKEEAPKIQELLLACNESRNKDR